MKYWMFLLALSTPQAIAKGLSPYLPLQISPEIELYIDKLFALTDGAPLAKPYKAVDILKKSESIKNTHPILYRKLNTYLQRYKKKAARTHSNIELSYSDDQVSMANQRGADMKSHYRISTTGFAYVGPYFIASLGTEKRDGGSPVHYASYIGFGNEYAQMEIGYRDHWFSPFQDSAMLTSINAAPSPSITLSNATPLTSWGIRYEVFASRLEKVTVTNADSGDVLQSKRPKLAGIHLSFNPLPNWSVGFNRTVQYGDNIRDLGLDNIIDDFVNPDQQAKETDDSTNHLASITSKINLDWGIPISLYAEYGGETSANNSLLKLGEETYSLGVFLPKATDNVSVRYEFNQWSSAWYIHPAFAKGYSNDGNIIGHWAAQQFGLGTNSDTQVHSLSSTFETEGGRFYYFTARTINSQDSRYATGYSFDARYSQAEAWGFWGIELNIGRTVDEHNFSRIALFYRW